MAEARVVLVNRWASPILSAAARLETLERRSRFILDTKMVGHSTISFDCYWAIGSVSDQNRSL